MNISKYGKMYGLGVSLDDNTLVKGTYTASITVPSFISSVIQNLKPIIFANDGRGAGSMSINQNGTVSMFINIDDTSEDFGFDRRWTWFCDVIE